MKVHKAALATGAALAISLSSVNVAAAVEGESSASETVQKIAPEVFDDVAGVEPTRGTDELAFHSEMDGATASVSYRAEDGVAISLDGTEGLRLGLPNSADATLESAEEGFVVFDNGDGSHTLPVIKTDGSVQITTVIDGPSSPTRYDYPLTVPAGTTAEILDSGEVIFYDVDGEFAGGVSAPWAKDSAGTSVPTHYELSNDVLTQVVEHSNNYPVVADPWAGFQLFGYLGTDRRVYEGQVVYSGRLSPWGWSIYSGANPASGGPISGNAIIRIQGWDEWRKKWFPTFVPNTIKQQYDCHVLGGYNIFGAGFHWDLERARPANHNWGVGIFGHRCNW